MATLEEALVAYRAGALFDVRRLCARCAASRPDPAVMAQVLHLDGVAAREIGDLTEAMSRFEEVARMVCDMPSLKAVMEGKLRYNMAIALWQYKRLDDALLNFRLAMVEFKEGFQNSWRLAGQNAAWVLVEMGRLGEARELLGEVEPRLDDTEAAFTQRITEAFLAVREGDPALALDRLAELLEASEVSANVQAMAASVGAEAALLEQDLDLADRLAERAVKVAADLRDARTHSTAHRVYYMVQQAIHARRQEQ
jgi:tetratricopeptide (TPR) repeat protein